MYSKVFNKRVLLKAKRSLTKVNFLTAFINILYLTPAQQKPWSYITSLFIFFGVTKYSLSLFIEYLNMSFSPLFHVNYMSCKNDRPIVKLICIFSIS